LNLNLPRLLHAAEKTANYIKDQLLDDGRLNIEVNDLACYYKAPQMFMTAGMRDEAKAVLGYIEANFLQPNGDFKSTESIKSQNPEYQEFWPYMNGWIIRAAQQLSFPKMLHKANEYLSQFDAGKNGGFFTKMPELSQDTDVLTTSHFGLLALECGDLARAEAAARYLETVYKAQLSLDKAFYLRMNKEGEVVTKFPKEMALFYRIDKAKSSQLYFMLGYPIAFLTLLYEKTRHEIYLNLAVLYFNFCARCNSDVFSSAASHKVAWAASLLYRVTHEKGYIAPAISIVDHLLSLRDENGMWYSDNPLMAYDQSSEVANWLYKIAHNLVD